MGLLAAHATANRVFLQRMAAQASQVAPASEGLVAGLIGNGHFCAIPTLALSISYRPAPWFSRPLGFRQAMDAQIPRSATCGWHQSPSSIRSLAAARHDPGSPRAPA